MLYAHYDETDAFIALEDLSFKNYVNIDRSCGLDFNHTRILLERLVHFHGISLAYRDQVPEFDKIASCLKVLTK